ncbi:RNase adapter RapZ [Sphingopyxis indica]|uniref:RNase adapter RapZ n=1 Tax=Sphingopyxis indica TaxID=436663 RepID=UPI002938EC66|nr:RNase adapter RapZ [Sphingopyxis indica]WOF42846.1 RNase adapter RapZ [Sphingopyxis indica]
MTAPASPRLLLVTGLSGAGKSTVLKVLEDLGWEVVDNLPLSLLEPLIEAPAPRSEANRPIAVGIDSRSRGFKPSLLVKRIKQLREADGRAIETLFLDCAGAELERRFSETRRRHPLAEDRPATDGIAREREMMEPVRRWAEHVVDTTNYSSNDLQQEIRHRFADAGGDEPALNILSFGYSRGLPRHADLVFDMRYLRNPHWDSKLRPGTGLDADVSAYIAADPAYEATVSRIEALLLALLPRYRAEGKSYVTIAFGCTGGRHRSVHVAERVARTLRAAGHTPTVGHRNLDSAPQDGLEGKPPPASPAPGGKK